MVSGAWESPQEKLTNLERALLREGAVVRRGGEFARWDLELQGGLLGGARVLLSVEDLCPGQQLVRFRSWPALRSWGLVLFMVIVLLAVGATIDRSWIVAATLGVASLALLLRTLTEAAYSQSTLLQLLSPAPSEPEPEPERDFVAAVGRSGSEGTS
jgi:hypothetical protein